MKIAMVALLVREYDEAIAFYRDVLGFTAAVFEDLYGNRIDPIEPVV